MDKTIYSNSRHGKGIFKWSNFQRYMDQYKGAELAGAHVANAGKDYAWIYHIEPQGVTLTYDVSEEGQISVRLFGSEEKIGEVERKILGANNSRKLLKTEKIHSLDEFSPHG